MNDLGLFHEHFKPTKRQAISRQYPNMKSGSPDHFQTDPVALNPLLKFLFPFRIIWECAAGKGKLVKKLEDAGHIVVPTDILTGQDFLSCDPYVHDAIVTNPPYTIKDAFLQRCYELEKPFALLLPLTTFDSRKRRLMMKKHGVEVVFLPNRVNFETPNGMGSSSWFATAWFTKGLNIGQQLTFTDEP
jgi:hypothetical protein